jgi:hypothetical protein
MAELTCFVRADHLINFNADAKTLWENARPLKEFFDPFAALNLSPSFFLLESCRPTDEPLKATALLSRKGLLSLIRLQLTHCMQACLRFLLALVENSLLLEAGWLMPCLRLSLTKASCLVSFNCSYPLIVFFPGGQSVEAFSGADVLHRTAAALSGSTPECVTQQSAFSFVFVASRTVTFFSTQGSAHAAQADARAFVEPATSTFHHPSCETSRIKVLGDGNCVLLHCCPILGENVAFSGPTCARRRPQKRCLLRERLAQESHTLFFGPSTVWL